MKKLSLSLLVVLLLLPVFAFAQAPLPSPAGANKEAAHHNEEGISHYQQGHWGVAKRHFKEAIAADQNFAEAHYNLALALHKEGKHADASQEFRKAAKLAPDNKAIQESGILRKHIR